MSQELPPEKTKGSLTRRSFLKGAGGVAAAGGLLSAESPAHELEESTGTAIPSLRGMVKVTLDINGKASEVEVEPRTTLLAVLRGHLEPALTGTKEVCDRGNCGACTVMVDGRPANACLLLAYDLEGRSVTTIEGLGTPDKLSNVQRAFCEKDATMCGFCTPGFVVSATACLERYPTADEDVIRRELSGNICRCGTYPHVFDAVRAVRDGGGK